MTKLNQIIAVEKGIKSRKESAINELYKSVQKPTLFDGLQREYHPLDDADKEKLPPENKRVQMDTRTVLKQTARIMSELFDAEAAKDYTNCVARADVILDGRVLFTNAPPTFLLFLEKQLTDMRTLISALPVLDPAESWTRDENAGTYRSGLTTMHRTKKVQRALTMTPTTLEHPGTAQLITDDQIVGHWHQTKLSGAMPPLEKEAMLDRLDALLKAVKAARSQANETDVVPVPAISSPIFGHLLGK